ncbi:MAG: patatin-like phospholipase family protein [Pseudomonadota bacterium]
MRHLGLATILAVILLTACTSISRTPASPDDIDASAPYGVPGVLRVWGDTVAVEQLDAIRQSLIARAQRMHAAELEAGVPISETILALSGGGADGAFGAGILAGWTEHGDRPTFDIVSGVSTGAIIGLFAFLGPEYDDDLRRFYTEYSTDQLLEPSPFAALTGGASLSDSAGYNALIDETINPVLVEAIAREADAGRILLIGTTNLDYARPVIWNVTEIARTRHPESITLIRNLIRASSAIPALFPPVLIPAVNPDGEIRDELHVDGGATQQVMVFSPELPIKDVDRALGAQIDRTIYVIMNNKLEKSYEPVDVGVLSIAGKAVSSLIGGSGTGDVYKIYAIAVRDGIDLRLLWVPRSFDVDAEEPFDPAYMTALYKLGRTLGAKGASWQNRPPNFTVNARP